jgi:hypothetical protein
MHVFNFNFLKKSYNLMWLQWHLGCVWDCDFIEKSVILNQITESEPFGNCVFKKLRFENVEKCLFKSQAMGCFFESAVF